MINGKWHAQGSAAQSDATLRSADGISFHIDVVDGASFMGALDTLKISDRLGNVERKVTLEDGSIFATSDNDAIDMLFNKHSSANGILHRIENNMGWVITALVVTVLSTVAFFKWGLPWGSDKIAHALPHETNQLIAGNTLKFLDNYLFDKSQLDFEKRHQIREHFKKNIAPLSTSEDSKVKYKLHFRAWSEGGDGIPNAFALPSGDIILTDKFVELSKSQDEIDSVLLHEMGHAIHRHTLKRVIEGTFATVIVMVVTGDSNGLADMGLGLGSLMLSSNYARDHESEADLYAFEHMLVAKIDPIAFSTIMNRMTKYMEELDPKTDSSSESKTKKDEETSTSLKKNKDDKVAEDSDKTILDYLSSHPPTEQRVEIARQYSECFKKGMTTCDIVIEKQ